MSDVHSRLVRHRKLAVITISGAVTALLLVFSSSTGQQQERPKPTNLQVLPPAISHDSLMDVMGGFTSGLGVGCDFCHVPKAPGSRDMDFAADTKEEKLIARAMITMTRDINQAYIGKIEELHERRVQVECVTCHRGQPRPEQLLDLLKRVYQSKGWAGVDSTYRALRNRYYGSHTFDFSEQALVHLAFALPEDKDADIIAALQLNAEFNPNSAFNQWALGHEYLSMGDTVQAVTALKRALEIDPNSRRAKRELEALGVKQ